MGDTGSGHIFLPASPRFLPLTTEFLITESGQVRSQFIRYDPPRAWTHAEALLPPLVTHQSPFYCFSFRRSFLDLARKYRDDWKVGRLAWGTERLQGWNLRGYKAGMIEEGAVTDKPRGRVRRLGKARSRLSTLISWKVHGVLTK